MPWCDSCAKFWNPNTLTAAGDCPTCGHHFGRTEESAPPVVTATAAVIDEDDDDDAWLSEYKAPWHFKLMVVMAAIYLLFRMIQMISWVV